MPKVRIYNKNLCSKSISILPLLGKYNTGIDGSLHSYDAAKGS